MPDPVDADTIAENANAPQSASVDGQAAAQVPIPDQIAAREYQKQTEAASGTNTNGGPRSGWRGVRMGRAIPPGAV